MLDARRALVVALYQAGRLAEARALSDSLAAEGDRGMAWFGTRGVVAAREGKLDDAARWSDSLAALPAAYRFGNTYYWQARIAALSGRPDAAVELLREALGEGLGRHHQIHAEPDFQSMRDFPGFRALLDPGR